jgi:hypothetical protein
VFNLLIMTLNFVVLCIVALHPWHTWFGVAVRASATLVVLVFLIAGARAWCVGLIARKNKPPTGR